MDQEQLCCLLRDLDRSLIGAQPTDQTQFLIQRWNTNFALPQRAKGEKRDVGAELAEELGLDGLADIIRNRGLRLRYLEDALKVDRVVVKGSLDVKQNLIKAITGQEPLDIDVTGGELRLEIRF